VAEEVAVTVAEAAVLEVFVGKTSLFPQVIDGFKLVVVEHGQAADGMDLMVHHHILMA
jgi:hypothetical protein